MDAAFLARIADAPDDDLARLVYADWLEEHGRAGDAERIRLAIRLDPDRDRYDDPRINAVRERVEALTPPLTDLPPGVEVEWRLGLPDTLCVPSPAFVEHGAALRDRFPTVRRLVLFRLNGWGERVAACEHLRGVRDLELACWYADADAEALAASHVADVERLTVWGLHTTGDRPRTFAHGAGFAGLKALHFEVWGARTRPRVGRRGVRVSVRDVQAGLIPIAPNFYGDEFFAGNLPDGSRVFAVNKWDRPAVFGVRFDAAGRPVGRIDLAVPPECVFTSPNLLDGSADYMAWHDEQLRRHHARQAFMKTATGFVPAFIRVERFAVYESPDNEGGDPWISVSRYRSDIEDAWGSPDEPDRDPSEWEPPGGSGQQVYDYVRAGSYTAWCGNDWWCDRHGRVVST